MKKVINVNLNGKTIQLEKNTMLMDITTKHTANSQSLIVAAKVNNTIKELTYRLDEDCNVEFIDLKNADGIRIYQRSVCFIFIKAMHEIFPNKKVIISHSISKGIYCEIKNEEVLTKQDILLIKKRMEELIKAKIPFIKKVLSVEEAEEIFKKTDRIDRLYILENRDKPYTTMYECDGFEDYLYGYMVPHTGYLEVFDLKYKSPGVIILFANHDNYKEVAEYIDQRKLFNIFIEFKRWGRILEVDNISKFNQLVKRGQAQELVQIAEALHEKKIAQIADAITNSSDRKKLVLISGPSSSGKTTFSHRLSIQLRVNGLKTTTISIDDYFLDRSKTPIDDKGEYDFESLYALDLKLFNDHLTKLVSGEEVDIPIFNFEEGKRSNKVRKMKIDDDHILVIEGIHGLNEKLTQSIPQKYKFKIYVSALTSLNIDDHNRISTTDTRLIRRIVRDNKFRACSALETIKRWPSVRIGEEKNIFPYQEDADMMFNSFLVYELSVLKENAEKLLYEIDAKYSEHSEAKRLIEFLRYFMYMDTKDIPTNSILREFVGSSCFYKS